MHKTHIIPATRQQIVASIARKLTKVIIYLPYEGNIEKDIIALIQKYIVYNVGDLLYLSKPWIRFCYQITAIKICQANEISEEDSRDAGAFDSAFPWFSFLDAQAEEYSPDKWVCILEIV